MRQGRQSSIDSWIVRKERMKNEYEYEMELAGSKQAWNEYLRFSHQLAKQWNSSLGMGQVYNDQKNNQNHPTHPSLPQKPTQDCQTPPIWEILQRQITGNQDRCWKAFQSGFLWFLRHQFLVTVRIQRLTCSDSRERRAFQCKATTLTAYRWEYFESPPWFSNSDTNQTATLTFWSSMAVPRPVWDRGPCRRDRTRRQKPKSG